MKRLKFYLLQMDNSTTTYKEMYEAKVVIPPGTYGNPGAFYEYGTDSMFWYEDISFSVELTNKASLDKPTFLIGIPAERLGIETYETTVADYCYRKFVPYIEKLNEMLYNRHKPETETGYYYTAKLGGEVLERNTAFFGPRSSKDYYYAGGNKVDYFEQVEEPKMCLFMRIQVQLPRKRIKKALSMLVNDLPMAVSDFVTYFDKGEAKDVVRLAIKQRELRKWLKESDYCAFIANGSILPRDAKTGLPLENAIPFSAPPEDEVEACGIKGLGIKRGVTVITGGGYSGKSTVLDTISAGIYDHCLYDGRELCVTDSSAMTISAEDGRCIKNIDISPFISWLPGGSTNDFSTDHASGSTSQAANILEAVDCGSKLLLIDEDRSATNFMIRDSLMKELVKREPITPFTERVNEIYKECKVSTILVIGGSGEYLSVADRVFLMDEYRMYDVSKRVREIAPEKESETLMKACWTQKRILTSDGFTSYPERFGQEKLSVPDIDYIFIGDEKIDSSGIHDVICREQRTAMAFMVRIIENRQHETKVDLDKEIEDLYKEIEEKGLDTVYSGFFPECERFLAIPRKCDLVALIYRMRNVNYTM